MYKKGILYWITGLSGAGKTTIGNRLYYELKKDCENVVLLDGDILKTIVDGENAGYSDSDRRRRAIKYAQICKTLTDQGIIVICCTIAMYDEVRDWNRKNNKGYIEIFLDVPMEVLVERDQKGMYSKYKRAGNGSLAGIDVPVEMPKRPDLTINNDGSLSIKECVDRILGLEVNFSTDFDRDVEYWNMYYSGNPDIKYPSLFAQYVYGERHMKSGRNLLELGCGNGRDSLFFAERGLNVTAIDASDKMICELQDEWHEKSGNICFICDDFVCSSSIYAGQYDYVYSRFTLHAINKEQEREVLRNVYKVLKEGGEFFIEVRSVNDEICGKGKKVAENTYIYNGHFRRFVVREELEEEMKSIGFKLEYSEEQRGFAPFGDSDPLVIRIIGKRRENNGDDSRRANP